MSHKLRELRKRAGLTQQQLAEKVGYKSKSAICAIEKGKKRLYMEKAMALSEVLGCSLQDLAETG